MPDATWNGVQSCLPEQGTLVKYRTALYQMLGYRDRSGRWVGMDGCEEELPVQTWRSLRPAISGWPERVA